MTLYTHTHPDIEYHAEILDSNHTEVFPTWGQAKTYIGDKLGIIDICIWSEEGAIAFGGSDALEQYRTDPDASVFERHEKTTYEKGKGDWNCLGMIA